MRTLLLLIGLSIHADVFARKCTFMEPEFSMSQLEEFYKQAEIVALVEDQGEAASGIQEVEVKRIWKGELSQRTYVHGESFRLAFLNRTNDGPLVPVTNTHELYCLIVGLSVEDIQKSWGEGVLPKTQNTEELTSIEQSVWLISLVVGGGVLMLVLSGFASRWANA